MPGCKPAPPTLLWLPCGRSGDGPADPPKPAGAEFAEPAYAEGDPAAGLDDPDTGVDELRVEEPLDPPAVGTLGTDPEPTEGSLVGADVVTDGTGGVWIEGVETVGVWIGGTGTGTGTGGLGTVIAGTVGVGSVGVETVGIGTETVGTVNAGLEWGRTSSATIVAAMIVARATGKLPRIQAPARLLSRLRMPLQPPVIARDKYPFLAKPNPTQRSLSVGHGRRVTSSGPVAGEGGVAPPAALAGLSGATR